MGQTLESIVNAIKKPKEEIEKIFKWVIQTKEYKEKGFGYCKKISVEIVHSNLEFKNLSPDELMKRHIDSKMNAELKEMFYNSSCVKT